MRGTELFEMVLRAQRGHPDYLSPHADGGVHGEWIEPAHGVVQSDPAIDLDLIPHDLADYRDAPRSVAVVELEHHRTHTGCGGGTGILHVIAYPREEAGRGVAVGIYRSLEKLQILAHGTSRNRWKKSGDFPQPTYFKYAL